MRLLFVVAVWTLSGFGAGWVVRALVRHQPGLAPRRRSLMVGIALILCFALRTVLGPAFDHWRNRADLEEFEAEMPMIRVLFTDEPVLRADYLAMLDSVAAAGASHDEARMAGAVWGRKLGAARMARYMAVSSDAAAADFADVFLGFLESLQRKDPRDCVDAMFGRSAGSARAVLQVDSAQEAEMARVMNAVFLEADRAPRTPVSLAERDSLLTIVRATMTREHGPEVLTDLASTQALGWRAAQPARACAAMVDLYQAIRALPAPAKGRMVRGLLGHYQPPVHDSGAPRRSS